MAKFRVSWEVKNKIEFNLELIFTFTLNNILILIYIKYPIFIRTLLTAVLSVAFLLLFCWS